MITKETIKDMAKLSMLSFSDEELQKMADTLTDSINSYKILNEVDTTNIEPTYEVNKYEDPTREDIVMESLAQAEVVMNTVEEQYGYFKILKVVD